MATAVAPSISSSLSSKEHLPTTSTLLLNPIVPASKAKAKPSFQAGEVLTWKDKYIYSTSTDLPRHRTTSRLATHAREIPGRCR